MNKKELQSWLLLDNHSKVGIDYINPQMPNEIFDDLNSDLFETYNHKCFTYSYYYLIDYLYRNIVYGRTVSSNYSLKHTINIFLGNHRKVYYITKAGGILDSIGYTKTTGDYPIAFYMDNNMLSFDTIRGSKQNTTHSSRALIKYPIKSFYRFDFESLNGTYYDHQNTHKVDVVKFIDIISNTNLGHIGFYIYSYIRMMNDRFPNGYQVSNKQLSSQIGCSERTVSRYLIELEKSNFISSERKLIGYKLLEKIYKTR